LPFYISAYTTLNELLAVFLYIINFYHWPTLLTQLIYTDFTVSYRDALDRLRVPLNSMLLCQTQHTLHIKHT